MSREEDKQIFLNYIKENEEKVMECITQFIFKRTDKNTKYSSGYTIQMKKSKMKRMIIGITYILRNSTKCELPSRV